MFTISTPIQPPSSSRPTIAVSGLQIGLVGSAFTVCSKLIRILFPFRVGSVLVFHDCGYGGVWPKSGESRS